MMIDSIYESFYFKLSFNHDFYYNVTMSKSYGEMLDEFQNQAGYRFWYFTHYLGVAETGVAIMFILIVAE